MMKFLYLIPFAVAALDQWIKQMVRTMPQGQAFFRMDPLFELVPSVNTGAAFSLLSGNNAVLALLSVGLLVLLCEYIRKTMRLTKTAFAAFMCLLGGAAGNLIDRIFFGGVTDYIRTLFVDFPIFNLADIAITCSVFVLIILLLTNQLEENTGE